jgi:uncharacterized Zn finger protein
MKTNHVISDPNHKCPCCKSTELEVIPLTALLIPEEEVRCNSCGLIYKRYLEDLTFTL